MKNVSVRWWFLGRFFQCADQWQFTESQNVSQLILGLAQKVLWHPDGSDAEITIWGGQ